MTRRGLRSTTAGGTISRASAIALGLVVMAASARAQVSREDEPRPDTSRDREAVPGKSSAAPSRDFTVELAAPLLYSTNPALASNDVVQGGGADLHFNPDLALRWSHQFPSVKVTAVTDVSVDRFFARSEDDEDTAFGSLKVALTDGRSGRFVPYVQYVATADLRPDFGEPDDVLHDFVLGLNDAVGIDADGRLIPRGDATKPGHYRFGVDLKALRRLADPKDFESTIVQAALELSYVYDEHWIFLLAPKVRLRWYDDFEGTFRRDQKPRLALKAWWTPDWLTAWNRRAEIDFEVAFERSYSTLPAARFTDWEIGPTLVLRWKF